MIQDKKKELKPCPFCDAHVYIKIKQYARPIISPVTRIQELRDELINLTGETYAEIPKKFCPVCGKKV